MTDAKRIAVGIDFGTTNTTLVYLKPQEKEPNVFLFEELKSPYIASAVTYPRHVDAFEDEPFYWGDSAKNKYLEFNGLANADLCEHFKMLLCAEESGTLKPAMIRPEYRRYRRAYEDAGRLPSQVAGDFFQAMLLAGYAAAHWLTGRFQPRAGKGWRED